MPKLGMRGYWQRIAGKASRRRPKSRARANFANVPAIESLEPRRLLIVQPLAMDQVPPGPWSIFQGEITGAVAAANGSAAYTINLQAGQKLSFSTRADSVTESFTLTDPGGNIVVSNSVAAGGTALLSPFTVSTTGTWTITLNLPVGGAGSYWLSAVVGAGFEGTGTAQGMSQVLTNTYRVMGNGLGRFAWLGESDATISVRDTDAFTVDLSAKVGQAIDISINSLGANFSAESLQIIAPDGVTVLAHGSAAIASGQTTATGLLLSDFNVPTAGVYTVRFTSSVAGKYSLVVSDAVDVDRLSALQVLNYVVDNSLTTQSSVAALIATVSFDKVLAALSVNETLQVLVSNNLVPGYTSVSALKAALPARGVNLASLRPDGVLTALSLASQGSLLASGSTPLTAGAAKAILQNLFNADRLNFLNALTARDLLQLFDDSIQSSASDPVASFNAYVRGTGTTMTNVVPSYIMWQRDTTGKTNDATAQAAWNLLSQQPVGQRVLYLSDFVELPGFGGGDVLTGYGYLDPTDGNGQQADYYSLWMDQWAPQAAAKISAFMNQLKALGGQVDKLIVDIETGFSFYHLQAYPEKVNPNSSPTATIWQVIAADPRWPAIKAQLIAAGIPEASLTPAALATWSSSSVYAQIWNAVMEQRLSTYLNAGVYAPFAAVFPTAIVSNFNQFYRTTTLPAGSSITANHSAFTVGSLLGNTQSVALYGWSGPVITPTTTLQPPIPFSAPIKTISYVPTLDIFGLPTGFGTVTVQLGQPIPALQPGLSMQIQNIGGMWIDTAYLGAFTIASVLPGGQGFTYTLQTPGLLFPFDLTSRLLSARTAIVNLWQPYNALVSDVKLLRTEIAASDAAVLPWVSSRDWLWRSAGQNYNLYTEGLFQAAMNGARGLLWWTDEFTVSTGNRQAMAAALAELNALIGYDNRTPLLRSDVNYTDSYILSGVDAGGRRVYRLTPDPNLGVTIFNVPGSVSMQIGSQSVLIPNATLYSPASPASTRGYWIVQTLGSSQLNASVDQILSRLEAAVGPTITPAAAPVAGAAQTFTLAMGAAYFAPGTSFTFLLDWNADGVIDQSVTGPSGTQVSYTFAQEGAISVRVTATPAGNARPAGATDHTILVLAPSGAQSTVSLGPDALNPSLTGLYWTGTSGGDTVTFERIDNTTIRVVVTRENDLTVNRSQVYSGVTGRVVANGLAGNDSLDARSLTTTAVLLDGGADNNTLYGSQAGGTLIGGSNGGEGAQASNVIIAGGGANTIYGNAITGAEGSTGGNNLIVGGGGNDTIYGAYGSVKKLNGTVSNGGEGGRSVIVGGGGSDTIYASQASDGAEGGRGSILVAGNTSLNQAALAAILSEWTSSRDYNTRVANISGSGSGTRNNGSSYLQAAVTVTVDGAADQVYGDTSGSPHWFLVTPAQDTSYRTKNGETATNTP